MVPFEPPPKLPSEYSFFLWLFSWGPWVVSLLQFSWGYQTSNSHCWWSWTEYETQSPCFSSTAKTWEENQFLSDEEEGGVRDGVEITYSAGGRRYRRLRVQPSKSHTPGVRRSKRTRIAPVRTWENEEVEYDMRRRSGRCLHQKGLFIIEEDPELDSEIA